MGLSPRSQPRSGGSGVPSSESCNKAKAKAKAKADTWARRGVCVPLYYGTVANVCGTVCIYFILCAPILFISKTCSARLPVALLGAVLRRGGIMISHKSALALALALLHDSEDGTPLPPLRGAP